MRGSPVAYLVVASVAASLCALPGGAALEVDAAEAFFDVRFSNEGERKTLHWAERCLHACQSACRSDPPQRSASVRLLRWDVDDDCAYRCTHACLAESMKHGGRMYKYRGKWPHTRVLGVQEPFSALFSLLNLAAHCVGYLMISACRRAGDQAAAGVAGGTSSQALDASGALGHIRRLQAMSCLWMGAWVSSSVFHARETWWSERLDYYSGNMAMAWMVYTSLARAAAPLAPQHRAWLRRLSGAVLSAGVGGHMVGNYPKINYGRNMWVMIGLLSAHTVAWLWSCMANPGRHNRLFYLSAALTYAAGLLEVLDFAPVLGINSLVPCAAELGPLLRTPLRAHLHHGQTRRTEMGHVVDAAQACRRSVTILRQPAGSLDAHALWHAATPGLTYMFYCFLSGDATGMWQQELASLAAKTR
jgi:hypothetical protein